VIFNIKNKVTFNKELKMKISSSIGYAIIAVCYIAKSEDKKIVMTQGISEQYNIPLPYLLKIMQQFVRANVLRGKRGPRGGFSLARPANKITMLEILEAIDGQMGCQLDLFEQAPNDKFCVKVEKVYQKAVAQVKAVYEKTKLSDMI